MSRSGKSRAPSSAVMKKMRSHDAAAREEAAWELGRNPGKEAVSHLVKLLADDNRNVVYAAVRALVGVGGEEVAGVIAPLLRVEDATARNLAVEILAGIGENAVPTVSGLTTDQNHDVRKFAVDILGMIASPSGEAALIKALFDDNTNVAVAAAEALGKAGTELAVPHLISCLSREPWIKCAAVKSLGNIAGEEAFQAILAIDPGEESIVLYAAVSALGDMGDTRAIGFLVTLLETARNMEAPVIQAANRILSRSYTSALRSIRNSLAPRTLISLLDHSNREVKKSAVVLLGMLREKGAVEKLSALYTEENQDMFEELDTALVSIHPVEITPLLEIFTGRSGSPSVRAALVRLFARLGNREALPAVLAVFNDADRDLQLTILQALPGFMGRRDLQRLHAYLEHDSAQVRRAAAAAACQFGDPASVGPLMTLASDPDEKVRETAARGLEQFDLSAKKGAVKVLLNSGDEQKILFGLNMLPQEMVPDFGLQVKKLARKGSGPVRMAAVRKAAFLGDGESVAVIRAAMQDDDSRVRLAGVRALERGRHQGVDDLLLDVAGRDQDHWNRYEAVQAIGRRGLRAGVDRLAGLFDGAPDLVQAAIVDVLGGAEGDAAMNIISRAEKSDREIVREAAAEALARHGVRAAKGGA